MTINTTPVSQIFSKNPLENTLLPPSPLLSYSMIKPSGSLNDRSLFYDSVYAMGEPKPVLSIQTAEMEPSSFPSLS